MLDYYREKELRGARCTPTDDCVRVEWPDGAIEEYVDGKLRRASHPIPPEITERMPAMAHFKKRRSPKKRRWVDWFFRAGREWRGYETWRKWKLRYVNADQDD